MHLAMPPQMEALERRVMPTIAPIFSGTLSEDFGGAVILRTRSEAQSSVADTPSQSNSTPQGFRPNFNLGGNGLQFNLIPAGGMSAQAIAGFQAAANLWSAILRDDILVNININFTALGAGILGQTGSSDLVYTVPEVTSALASDSKSLSDQSTVANLPSGNSLSIFTSIYSSGADVLDNNSSPNNLYMDVNTANAKALGLHSAGDSASDGSISFSTLFNWDFDRSNGITAGTFDFVGVAAHEIGHLLGFVSGADSVDYCTKPNGPAPQSLENYAIASPLDLFRYSAGSESAGANIDLRSGSVSKYFSVDGGTTQATIYSTGSYNGDGRQCSHWKDNQNIGIMDPTADYAEFMDISDFDVQAFDVMGWDVAMDLGDAPDTGSGTSNANYSTTLSDNGPRHLLFKASGAIADPTGSPKVYLGSGVTGELAAQQNGNATGDTDNGIPSFPTMPRGTTQNVTVASTGGGAKLNYFFDFNRDGDFTDSGESFLAILNSVSQSVSVVIPAGAAGGTTFARFRISTAGGLTSVGPANDGEVEDYQVTIVNTPPVAQASSVTTNEDTARPFVVSDFSFADADGDGLASITISSLNLLGGDTLKLSGTSVTAGQTIAAANIASLVYTPFPNANGSGHSSFDFKVNDSDSGSIAASMNINVSAVNDPPMSLASSVTTNEDNSKTFAVSDFLFSDVEGDSLASITISSLSLASGDSLKLTGTDVTVNQLIPAANIANLVYIPVPNANGNGRSSFNFKVNDQDTGIVAAAMSINVTAVNDVPVAQASSVTTDEDTARSFIAADFSFTDVEGNSLASITIGSLNLAGGDTLKLSGMDVTSNQTIAAANLANLVYLPASNTNGTAHSTFDFTVNDAGSGTVTASMTINVTAVNDAPVAQASSVTTNEDTSRSFSVSNFPFLDVEGDSLASITISKLDLANGDTLKLGGSSVTANQVISAANIANLVYTPALNANGSGRSSFDFKVNDSNSGVLAATMTIDVTAVNDAPVSQASSLATNEDTTRAFAVTDFLFADAESDSLASITIDSLSLASGDTLTLGGTDVAANQTLASGNIADLVYTPSPNANGAGRSSFNFAVNDSDTGTAAAVMSISVTPVNDLPVARASSVTTSEDTARSFAASDFLFTDVEDDSLASITIKSLNLASGDTLTSGGTNITVGQTILATELSNLVYMPALDANGSSRSSFDFTVNDVDFGTAVATMSIDVTLVNDEPILNTSFTPMLPAIAMPQPKNEVIAGTPISSLVAHVNDVDNDPKGIAVTGYDATRGQWQFSIDSGVNWTSFDTVGTISDNSALLLADDGLTQIRFQPNKASKGVKAFKKGFANLTYRSWDQSDGSSPVTPLVDAINPASTAFSTNTEHAWVMVGKATPAVDVDGHPVLKAISIPKVVPTKAVPSSAYTVKKFLGLLGRETDPTRVFGIAVSDATGTGVTGTGEWQFNIGNGGWKQLGSVSELGALLLRPHDKLRYVKGPTFNGNAEITYHTWDMAAGTFGKKVPVSGVGFSTARETAIANAAPILKPAHPTFGSAQAGATTTPLLVSDLLGSAATDVEQTTLGIYVYAPKGGTWEYSSNGSDWTKVTKGVYLESTTQIRFTAAANAKVGSIAGLSFKAWDQTLKTKTTLSKLTDRITVDFIG